MRVASCFACWAAGCNHEVPEIKTFRCHHGARKYFIVKVETDAGVSGRARLTSAPGRCRGPSGETLGRCADRRRSVRDRTSLATHVPPRLLSDGQGLRVCHQRHWPAIPQWQYANNMPIQYDVHKKPLRYLRPTADRMEGGGGVKPALRAASRMRSWQVCRPASTRRLGPRAHLPKQERAPIIRRPDAGWSSLVARRAHNPKVVGSNPAPATIRDKRRLIAALEHWPGVVGRAHR